VRIHNQQDFWSGVMFTVCGVAFAAFAREYDMGTGQRMGPAFFPTMLGILLVVLGVIVGIKGLAGETNQGKVEKFHFDALGWVLGAVVLFGLLLRPAGLIVALLVLIGVSAFGSHDFKWKEAVLLSIGLVLLVLAVFIWGLKLTIPIFPAFMQN
jgi:putative tricarboxylic transport membrane protein